jgi:hypothetical protein
LTIALKVWRLKEVDNLTLIWVYVDSTSDSSKLSRRESADAGEEIQSTIQATEM